MKTNFRTTVFERAYQIMNSTKECFAVCLSRAWQLYRLAKSMKKDAIEFTYKKVDGSLRKAIGTLKDVQQFVKGSANTPKYNVFHYFDCEAVAFRCFRVENLVSIK